MSEKEKNMNPYLVCFGIVLVSILVIAQALAYKNPNSDISDSPDGNTFMSYDGPIFPLTTMDDTEGIEVIRAVNFDFAPYRKSTTDRVNKKAVVHDEYQLTNSTDEDKMITFIYPYVSTLAEERKTKISVNDDQIDTTLYIGMFSGSFSGVSSDTTSLNIDNNTFWTDYKYLLEDGSYMKEAFSAYPELNEPVTVYELSDIKYNGNLENAVLSIEFAMDYEDTFFFDYGFNGGSDEHESGEYARSFYIQKNENEYESKHYLVVLGKDIKLNRLQGYKNNRCNTGDEIEGIDAKITRYETTMNEIFKIILDDTYEQMQWYVREDEFDPYVDGYLSKDIYYGELCRVYTRYGLLGSEPKQRYTTSLEDMLGDVDFYERVLYEAFEVEIPAGGTVTVSAELVKEGSFNFHGKPNAKTGIEGYDLVTQLGSTLKFTKQSASFTDLNIIKIINTNFGVVNDSKQVELNNEQEHYFIEVNNFKYQ